MGAPLLPKLRGHFAEFLRESYLAPLGILYLPTCVSFGYRYSLFNIVRAFLGSMTSGKCTSTFAESQILEKVFLLIQTLIQSTIIQ
jgi:hypothetical protein